MQQQELAQMRHREANLTALAAIGPRKKRKILDSPSSSAAAEVTLILMRSLLIVLRKSVEYLAACTFHVTHTGNSFVLHVVVTKTAKLFFICLLFSLKHR